MTSAQKKTIYDIAYKAKTSASTVSAALNGSWKRRRIKEETVERIQKIALEEGYAINRQARGLRKAQSGLVGMMLPEHDNRFFSSLSQAFAFETRKRNLCPAIVSARRNPDEERDSIISLISYAVDFLVIVGASAPEQLDQICKENGISHIFVDQPCASAPSIVSDNEKGTFILANTLLHSLSPPLKTDPTSWLYFLGGNAHLYASSQRIKGFKAAILEKFGMLYPDQVIACGYEPDICCHELEKLYNRLGRLPAGLLINSIDAFEGVLSFLAKLPEKDIQDCHFGCYDYDPFGILLRFPVHMIRQRADILMRKVYEKFDSADTIPCLTLVEPELIRADK